MTATEHRDALTAKLSAMAGVAVEITIRGARAFTISIEQRNERAADKLAAFFASGSVVSVEHDDECGSFVYVDA